MTEPEVHQGVPNQPVPPPTIGSPESGAYEEKPAAAADVINADDPTIVLPASPLHRPSSLDPKELGFTPQDPVPWLGPGLLAATGARVALAEQFGAYLDKRELQGAFPTRIYDEHAEADEVWLDYIADLGDGFNATYSMAWLLAQPTLRVGPAERHSGHDDDSLVLTELPRGELLVMGGDQVYPTASGAAYEDRMVGPYLAAFSTPEKGVKPPSIFALPGNHDWYDGLTAFLRLFARREDGHIGA
ncbi:MAG: hypothetical protein HOV83_29145, partial [Catenulispora sp.]|nr:hypothetical protein [Catenulispora sp.]